jgi:SAM-dependent methyltransferase
VSLKEVVVKPSSLLNFLSVPGKDIPLRFVATHLAGDEPFCGWLEDAEGNVVGRLNKFRFEFVNFTPVAFEERVRFQQKGPESVKEPTRFFVEPFDKRIHWYGETIDMNDYIRGFHGDDASAYFSFTTKAPTTRLKFHKHGWSGIGRVDVDGQYYDEVDLFNQECSISHYVNIQNLARKEITITVGVTGRSHPDAQSKRLLLEGIEEFGEDEIIPIYQKVAARNRGGAFAPRFYELMALLGEDALVLDVGGGKRQLDDLRYINLEYTAHEEPDLLGDGTILPFRSNSFDLVYTAAVLEHVRDPIAMGREIYRVLKPGGIVLANSAFMQPIHSEGQHFFNLTPYGLELCFEQFEKRSSWVDTSFVFTLEWFVDVLGVRGKVPSNSLEQFFSVAREIESQIPANRAPYVASGVWLEAVKR